MTLFSNRVRRLVWSAAVVWGLCGVPVAAAVKPARARRGPALAAAEVARLRAAVLGADEAAAVDAAKALAASRADNAVEPLIEALAAGTTVSAAAAFSDALGALGDARAVQVLTLYSGNRNLPVRVAAVKALGALGDARVVGTLLERLGDAAPEVRAAAAAALGARREPRAADRILRLVLKNDPGAAEALGQTLPVDRVSALAEQRGRVSDDALASALGAFLVRPDVPDRLRIDVIRSLERVPGAAATTALVEYLASVPEGDRRPSKAEAQRAVDAREAGK